jgi:hypothetical protein
MVPVRFRGMTTVANRVLVFPVPGRTAEVQASRWAILLGRVREGVRRALTRLGLPGALRSVLIEDELTGQRLEITIDPLFTRISVNGRDYFFDRLTGRYDGTGMGCS